jgi:hypothetical protein
MRVEDGFQPVRVVFSSRLVLTAGQVPFSEGHPYITDPVIPSLLKRLLPHEFVIKILSSSCS